MAELHPVLEEALAPFMRAQTKDRDAIAAYQEILHFPQPTMAEVETQDVTLTAAERRAVGLAVQLVRGSAFASWALTPDDCAALAQVTPKLAERTRQPW